MPANTGGARSFYFPPSDGASGGSVARCLDTESTQWTQYRQSLEVYCSTQYSLQCTLCIITKTYKVFTWSIHIGITKWLVLVLNLRVTVWYSITLALTKCILTEALSWACLQMAERAKTKCSVHYLRSVYCTVHALGLVRDSKLPWGMYCWIHTSGVSSLKKLNLS